ncbi:hypothetical protein Tco_0571490 [Tanacetum coccineum]
MSGEGDRSYPLYTEEMNLNDQQLKPRKCGYDVIVTSGKQAEALCKVHGEIEAELRDEANVADPYRVAVLVDYAMFKKWGRSSGARKKNPQALRKLTVQARRGPPKIKKSKKSKESNKEVFTIYLHYDGLFITSPLTYAEGSRREINDINFDGIKECNSDNDVRAMLKASYVENVENDSDYYDSDDYEDIENVDFQTEADDNVVIKDFSTHDGFLNTASVH